MNYINARVVIVSFKIKRQRHVSLEYFHLLYFTTKDVWGTHN